MGRTLRPALVTAALILLVVVASASALASPIKSSPDRREPKSCPKKDQRKKCSRKSSSPGPARPAHAGDACSLITEPDLVAVYGKNLPLIGGNTDGLPLVSGPCRYADQQDIPADQEQGVTIFLTTTTGVKAAPPTPERLTHRTFTGSTARDYCEFVSVAEVGAQRVAIGDKTLVKASAHSGSALIESGNNCVLMTLDFPFADQSRTPDQTLAAVETMARAVESHL